MTNANNCSAGKPAIGGSIYRAPLGTTLPTDAKAVLDAGFVSLGYISEDGLKNSNSPSAENKKAWGGDTILVVQTEKPDEFSFKMVEALNVDVLKSVYGTSRVTGDIDSGITVVASSDMAEKSSYVVDMIMANNVVKRIVIPQATMKSLEEITYSDSDAIGYGVTLSATPDETGATHYEYIVKK